MSNTYVLSCPIRFLYGRALKTESLSIVIRRGEPKQQTIGRLFRIPKAMGRSIRVLSPSRDRRSFFS